MSIVLLALIYSAAMRAFLFEIKFETIRTRLAEKHWLFDKFLTCAFCNGFWTGLFTYLILVWGPNSFNDLLTGQLLHAFYFAVTVGVIGWIQRSHTSMW